MALTRIKQKAKKRKSRCLPGIFLIIWRLLGVQRRIFLLISYKPFRRILKLTFHDFSSAKAFRHRALVKLLSYPALCLKKKKGEEAGSSPA